jgi:hypothetical protein
MTITRRLFVALALTVLTLNGRTSAGAAGAAGAQDGSPPPILFIQGSVERTDGTQNMTALYQVADGPGVYTLGLRADPATCRVSTKPDEIEPWAAWKVAIRPVSTDDEEATVDVTWSRTITEHGVTASETEETLRLVLTPGQPTPIDIINAPARAGSMCRRFLVQLGASIGEDDGRSVLAYDLWLVHRDATGREQVQRQQSNGQNALKTPFIFAPRYYTREGVSVADRNAGAFSTSIFGNVRGRVRADGSLTVSLETTRGIAAVDGHSSVSFGGVKELHVQPGETIEVAIPPMTDRLAQLDRDGELGVAGFASALQRQSTSIRITTTRLR